MSLSPFSSTVRKTITYNTLYQILGRILTSGTTFIVSVLLVRQFGIYDYGDFIKITTFITPFYLLTDFGINAIYIQLQIQNKSVNEPRDWISLVVLRTIIGFIVMFLILFIVMLLPKGTTEGYTTMVRRGILLFAPTLLIQALITSANAVFQNHMRYLYSTISIFTGSVITLGAILLLTLFAPKPGVPIYSSLSLAFGALISVFVSLLFVNKIISFKRLQFHKNTIIYLLQKSTPLGLTLIFNLIYFRIDMVLLTLSRTTSEVGIYGFIYKVFEFGLVFPTLFMNSLYPILLAKKGSAKSISSAWRKVLVRSTFLLLGVSFITFGIFFYAADFLPIIKEDFSTGITPFRILSSGLPFFYLSGLTMWLLISLEKYRNLVIIYGISMILNILLNMLTIPFYGIIAASWVTVFCEAFVLMFSLFILFKTNIFNKKLLILTKSSLRDPIS